MRLLCYDPGKAASLGDIARSGDLEPHPVSGEVEVDWDYDVETRFRRLDSETMQTLVAFKSLGLAFQLVYCTGDEEGGGDGWRVGEVTVPDKPSPFSVWGGMSSLADAEADFEEKEAEKKAIENYKPAINRLGVRDMSLSALEVDDDDDDDDDYWARYDATPARTPITKQPPAPISVQQSTGSIASKAEAEDAYYAQYADVQPAMDNHDPDEAAQAEAAGVMTSVVQRTYEMIKPSLQNGTHNLPKIAPPLGLTRAKSSHDDAASTDAEETTRVWSMVEEKTRRIEGNENRVVDLVHPRPASNASSSGSQIVKKLEASAGKKEQSEFGIKQHVGRTVRSLFSLSRAAGIERAEFERLIKTELDMLGMMEDEEHI